jgi:hypothetical protein
MDGGSVLRTAQWLRLCGTDVIRTAAAHREVRPTDAVLISWVDCELIDRKRSDDSEGRRPQVVDGRPARCQV